MRVHEMANCSKALHIERKNQPCESLWTDSTTYMLLIDQTNDRTSGRRERLFEW
jgi:hypothetical protein